MAYAGREKGAAFLGLGSRAGCFGGTATAFPGLGSRAGFWGEATAFLELGSRAGFWGSALSQHVALDVSDLAMRVTRATPPRSRPLEQQLLRSVSSIALNIAEGAAEFSPGDKARFHRIARPSAAEAGAAFDLLARHGIVSAEAAHGANERLETIAAMLTRMIHTAHRRTLARPAETAGIPGRTVTRQRDGRATAAGTGSERLATARPRPPTPDTGSPSGVSGSGSMSGSARSMSGSGSGSVSVQSVPPETSPGNQPWKRSTRFQAREP